MKLSFFRRNNVGQASTDVPAIGQACLDMIYALSLRKGGISETLAGMVKGLGIDEAGAVQYFPVIKQAARDMGASV